MMNKAMKWVAVAVTAVGLSAGAAEAPAAKKAGKAPRKIEVTVTEDGFVPAKIDVKRFEKVELVVTRKTERTCTKSVHIESQKIDADLPMEKAVTIPLDTRKKGAIAFSCPHKMFNGEVQVN